MFQSQRNAQSGAILVARYAGSCFAPELLGLIASYPTERRRYIEIGVSECFCVDEFVISCN